MIPAANPYEPLLIQPAATCSCHHAWTRHSHHACATGDSAVQSALQDGTSSGVHHLATDKLLDAFGHDIPKIVTVDMLKARFFILGLQTGFALQMFFMSAVLMATAYHQKGSIEELAVAYYPLFRGLFLIGFFASCYGVVLFAWKRHGVDYRSVLGVPSEHNYHAVVRGSFTVMSSVFACFALYVLTLTSSLTPDKHAWPLSAALATLLFLLWPRDWMPEWRDFLQRVALIRCLARVLTAPLTAPAFADTVLADVLTSMPKLLLDFLRMSCLYSTGEAFRIAYDPELGAISGTEDACTPGGSTHYFTASAVLSLLPFEIRLMQCVRQLVATGQRRHALNCVKYCCSMTVVGLSLPSQQTAGLHAAWWAISVFSTLFAGGWDLYADWGHPLVHPPLEPHADPWVGRRFPRWSYQLAASTNCVARLGWAVYISPGQKVADQHIILLLGCVELLRRAQWIAFRIEWEQHCRAHAAWLERRPAAAAEEGYSIGAYGEVGGRAGGPLVRDLS